LLLSAAAHSLSLGEVSALSEEAAFELFRDVRWGARSIPMCCEGELVPAEQPAVALPSVRAPLIADLGDAVRPP
jgi:hypothetical protein